MADAGIQGDSERPFRVAVIGSGPSAFYAVEALFSRLTLPLSVDLFDRLPVPYGLVRGGVAPDHQNIKKVIKAYERIALRPEVRFYGNVCLGRDLSAEDLNRCYDASILAVGNESDRALGIPGEGLAGIHSATEFVGWYNAHPDHRAKRFKLDVSEVAIVGVGNVAADVIRILVKRPDELATTDIADYSLKALREAQTPKTVHVFGRRGAAQAAFSLKELKELAQLENADFVVPKSEVVADSVTMQWLEKDEQKVNRQIFEFMQAQSEVTPVGKRHRIVFHFLCSPCEAIGTNGALTSLKVERNSLIDDHGIPKAVGTAKFETYPVQLLFKSIGYRGEPIIGVPFDERAGRVANANGRVIEAPNTPSPVPGWYVVGWAKRGPSGLIGDNKLDSIATIECLKADLEHAGGLAGWQNTIKSTPQPERTTLEKLLADRKIRSVSFAEWQRLDAEEIRRGETLGKVRNKFSDPAEMLSFLER